MTLTDRSRIVCYHRCPRERYLCYHCNNTGIRLSKLSLPLTIGIATHKGVEGILSSQDIIQAAIVATQKEWLDKIKVKEVIDNDILEGVLEDQLAIAEEQKALIEALIWTYYYIQYSRLTQEYDIVAVEKEINWNLTDDITVMSRVDAILRSKDTGGLVVYSLKTASEYNDYNAARNKYDDQGISELIAVEREYKEPVEAVKMDYLIKGKRRSTKDKSTGLKRRYQDSFLVHPWKMDTGLTQDYAIKYSWLDEVGKEHRLGKNWQRCNIWEDGFTPKEWVEHLMNGEMEALENIVVTPPLYYRNEEDVRDWLEQNTKQEEDIHENVKYLKHLDSSLPGPRESNVGLYRTTLNKYFPYRRESCFQYGGFCDYVDICWNGVKTTSSLYEARTPHHELELVQLKKG